MHCIYEHFGIFSQTNRVELVQCTLSFSPTQTDLTQNEKWPASLDSCAKRIGIVIGEEFLPIYHQWISFVGLYTTHKLDYNFIL